MIKVLKWIVIVVGIAFWITWIYFAVTDPESLFVSFFEEEPFSNRTPEEMEAIGWMVRSGYKYTTLPIAWDHYTESTGRTEELGLSEVGLFYYIFHGSDGSTSYWLRFEHNLDEAISLNDHESDGFIDEIHVGEPLSSPIRSGFEELLYDEGHIRIWKNSRLPEARSPHEFVRPTTKTDDPCGCLQALFDYADEIISQLR